MIGSSIVGHITASIIAPVAKSMVAKVDRAGFRAARLDRATTQIHPAITASIAATVIHGWALPKKANTPPKLATMTGGRANGRTQQTPHATAAVEAVAATVVAALSSIAEASVMRRSPQCNHKP